MEAKILRCRRNFVLFPSPPFHFDGTFHKPSHFQNAKKMSDWHPSLYCQSMRFGGDIFGIEVEDKGSSKKPKIKITVYSEKALGGELESIKKEIAWRFDLCADLKEFSTMARRDNRFFPVFRKWMGMRNSSQHSLYELLIIAIVLQNATVRRSIQMLDALLGRYGSKVIFNGKELYSIWPPEAMDHVPEQELRSLKIGYRAKFVKRLSHDFAEGKVDETALRSMGKDSTKKELMKLYGVGPETARILLSEIYHHYDTFDHIAPWQQKIYSMLFYGKKLVPTKRIRDDILKRYGNYSMLAVHYIWEDVFWRRKHEKIEWLEKEIRL